VLSAVVEAVSSKTLLEQITRASMIAGPETQVRGDSLLHTILRHLERHDMNLVLVRIHVCL
jgi:hypothetical protein